MGPFGHFYNDGMHKECKHSDKVASIFSDIGNGAIELIINVLQSLQCDHKKVTERVSILFKEVL